MGNSANVITSHADGMVDYHAQGQIMGHANAEYVSVVGDGQVKPASAQTAKRTVIHPILLKSAWAEDHVNVESASVEKTIQGNIVMSVR
jgi:nitroimidazol reductase NimA-like FMN-containing flavoprotein (pyridoxamine 5'-phosphate oxidase superfamily)